MSTSTQTMNQTAPQTGTRPQPLDPQPLEPQPLDPQVEHRLSRFTFLRPSPDTGRSDTGRPEAGLVAESARGGGRLRLDNPTRQALLLAFTEARPAADLVADLDDERREAVLRFLGHCRDLELIVPVDEDGRNAEETRGGLAHWEPHDLLFHERGRFGRDPSPRGGTGHLEHLPAEPAVAPTPERPDIDLESPAESSPLGEILARRRTRYGVEPVDLDDLSSLLYRAGRVLHQSRLGPDRHVRKPYPSGGARHPLDLYAVVERCRGLERGVYRYRAHDHGFDAVPAAEDDRRALLEAARRATGGQVEGLPSVLLVATARPRRVARKYQSIAYRLVLVEWGALLQNLYLGATELGLSPCAIGTGDSSRFARVLAGDDYAERYHHETSVGEMILSGPEEGSS